MTTNFIGENLLPGQLGHFFIILSFIASFFSGVCFFLAAKSETTDPKASLAWKRLARGSFLFHTIGIIAIFSVLYYVITHHLFEYNYAYQHSNKELPMKYLLSCFWEGQEGSFMLWTFWHCVLGWAVIRWSKGLENRAMTVISGTQVALTTMLLGFYLTPELKIGSTPFILLRDAMVGAPIFSDPNYLANFIKDGNGLNVLLQNYWMVIHPPVLFLGFASTLVPFSFIIAALWKGDYSSFIKPTIIATLFSGAALGTGIMMGGAWAYESLNFGGYWAWDPVENASLVPWLTMVAGLHTLIIFKATGRSLKITMVLYALTYALVWYSTFLTRTGVLGDTSVHAFTGEGKSLYWHLLVVLGTILILSAIMMARRWRSMPSIPTEEALSSREFWMTIGAFVFILSAAHIILVTSIPVYAPLVKWLSGKEIAPPNERELHYNNVQVWIAIMLGLLSGATLYLKFKKTETKAIFKKFLILGGIALLLSLFIGFGQKISGIQYVLMLFSAVFAIVACVYYAFGVQKGKLKKRGAALTHFGFAVTLLGVLLSSYGKEVLSINTTGAQIDLGKSDPMDALKESQENILLFRGSRVAMGDYFATYLGDSSSKEDPRQFFKVRFERIDPKTKQTIEEFVLYPDAFVNPKGQQGLSSNPDTRHYLNRDIFTYVNSIYKAPDKGEYKSDTLHAGDTLFLANSMMVFEGFERDATREGYRPRQEDVTVGAKLKVHTLEEGNYDLKPLLVVRDNQLITVDDSAKGIGLYTRFAGLIPEQNAAIIDTKQLDPKDQYIVLKALLFPYINVLWIGILLTAFGFLMSMWNRITKKA